MKTIIYPSLFIGICLLSLVGCKKENSASPKFDDYFILESASGVKDTFVVNTPSLFMDLSFVNYKSSAGNYYSGRYVKQFSLFRSTFADNYELVLAKPDDAVSIGQVYRTNNTDLTLTSFTRTNGVSSSTTATTTDIKFSEYKATERISGSFTANYNGVLWYKGNFSFNPTH